MQPQDYGTPLWSQPNTIMTPALGAGPQRHRSTPCPRPNPAYTAPLAPTPQAPLPIAHPTKHHPRQSDHHRGRTTRRRCRVQPAPDAGVMAWNPIRRAQPASARASRSARCNTAPMTSASAASARARDPTARPARRPTRSNNVNPRQSNARTRACAGRRRHEKQDSAPRAQRKCHRSMSADSAIRTAASSR